jgi:hypothetical protein
MQLGDINLDDELAKGYDKPEATQKAYDLWLSRFAIFCKVDILLDEHFSDGNPF